MQGLYSYIFPHPAQWLFHAAGEYMSLPINVLVLGSDYLQACKTTN